MTKEIYINSTLSFCSHCNCSEFARIVSRDSKVYLERMCPILGVQSVIIASDFEWYNDRMHQYKTFPEPKVRKESKLGCPKDCGLCQWHSNSIIRPCFSITNDCNLDCPKCFTFNRKNTKYYITVDETKKIINEIIKQSGGVQLINISGGEPTLHPNLFEIIATCRQEGIEIITMSTNGIRIAADKEFAKKIKESGVQLVFSLDSLSPEVSKIICGRDIVDKKLKALEYMEELDIPVTILSVAIKNLNEKDISDIASIYLRKEFVRSITIQNMTYTGLNGSKFQFRDRITIDDIEKALSNKQDFNMEDFFPLASYHPMCYSVAYYFSIDGMIIPLRKILDKDSLIKKSAETYFLNPNNDFSREFLNGINELWAKGEDDIIIRKLKDMVNTIYPADRKITSKQRDNYIEKHFKMIYIHPYMDEDNFDIDRVSRCGDIVPDENGSIIPACSHLLIYRKMNPRFWVES